MIEGHERMRLMDEKNNNHLTVEVNWKDDAEINECKLLKLTYPDGKTAFIKKEYFLSFLFAIGNREEQMKMVPQKIQRMKWYETTVGVKALKDIKKGEMINFPIKLSIPVSEEEIIAEIKRKKSDLVLPT
jgi:hypothetical protein